MNLCTIIAKNYVAQARVLARSFHEHHPGGRCFVLVVDDPDGYIDPAREPFSLLTPADLELDRETFRSMATIYDVLELSTAVKPSLLAALIERLSEPVLYLDPDIQIFGSLEEAHGLAAEHRLVLTPHLTEPMPRDGASPSEVQILASGAYNLGFVALGPGEDSSRLLRWWAQRLRHDCMIDHPIGLFVDQRWFDMAPSLMDDSHFHILRDPGYNVAYWNLATRRLARVGDGRYSVNGRPLRFFHFSGHDPDLPHLVSKHQDRHSLAQEPLLRELFHRYGELLRGDGYQQARGWPYGYGLLPDGTPLSPWLRSMFRTGELAGELERSPFTPEGLEAFYEWLREPAAPGGCWGVSRYLGELYQRRADLRAAYPDLAVGEHASGLVGWALRHGAEEVPIPGALLPALPAWWERPRSAPERLEPGDGALPWGVNVAGYLRSELGVGEAARLAIGALDAAEVPLMPVHASVVPSSRQGHPFACVTPDAAPFAVNLLCVNADRLPGFARDAGPGFFAGRYQIGMWWWEVISFPKQWLGAFDLLDELWVATRHIAGALSPLSPIPVVRVPIPVSVPPPPKRSRAQLGLPEGFVFLFMFDFNSVLERKNPHGVVEAFIRAVEPGSGASLVLKSINGEQRPEEREKLRVAAADRPDVHLLEGYVSAAEKNAMIASADCYVSLHRSEGLGLTLAEAMYLGTPVIATSYSGNLDFMTERNGHLVPCAMREIGTGNEPYPAEGEWAEPDLGEAAAIMRQVIADPGAAAQLGRRAASDIRQAYSPHAAGRVMRERLEAVRGRRGANRGRVAKPGEGSRAAPVELDAARELVGAALPPARSHPARIARRAVERLARQRIAHQRRLDERLVEAIAALGERLAGAIATNAALRGTSIAQALTELRRQDRLIAELAPDPQPLNGELERLGGHARRVESWIANSDDVLGAAEQLLRQSRARPDPALLPFETFPADGAGLVYGYRASGRVEQRSGYAGFEDLFRGGEQLIRDRQRVYLELLADRQPVLDAGCGRGEFLDLLRERGCSYVGVDLDGGMVARCRSKGHLDVIQGDVNEYLSQSRDGSLGAVFCAQVIEHLPVRELERFLGLSARKLMADGLLVAETVNPHCAQALKAFWVDLTHQQPIFPEVALALCADAGFRSAYVFHPNASGDVDRDRFEAGDYCVVAAQPHEPQREGSAVPSR